MLISCLEEVQELYNAGTSDQKKKAETAKDILNNIYNIKFALNLAVLCDVYTIYSQIAVLLQVFRVFQAILKYFIHLFSESVHTPPLQV